MTHPSAPRPASASSLRVLTFALAAAPVIVTVAVLFVLGVPSGSPDLLSVACLGLVAVGAVMAETVGFVVPAIPAGGTYDPQHVANESVATFQTAAIRRFVAIEAPFIVSLALGFSFTESAWPVLVTVVPTVLLILLEIAPSRRNADRTAARLEREGAPSYLHQGLGLA
ncbi:hypothetical protein [Solicola sp. PLA-1-18]|uniref:hypothetical protein n=1 Tax=Solicola sp. PLA-1-18 TaxID=3380532 RepID=UPI003B80FD00